MNASPLAELRKEKERMAKNATIGDSHLVGTQRRTGDQQKDKSNDKKLDYYEEKLKQNAMAQFEKMQNADATGINNNNNNNNNKEAGKSKKEDDKKFDETEKSKSNNSDQKEQQKNDRGEENREKQQHESKKYADETSPKFDKGNRNRFTADSGSSDSRKGNYKENRFSDKEMNRFHDDEQNENKFSGSSTNDHWKDEVNWKGKGKWGMRKPSDDNNDKKIKDHERLVSTHYSDKEDDGKGDKEEEQQRYNHHNKEDGGYETESGHGSKPSNRYEKKFFAYLVVVSKNLEGI